MDNNNYVVNQAITYWYVL